MRKVVLFALLLCGSVNAQIAAESSAVTTGPTASANTHDLGIPTGGSAGEVIIMGASCADSSKNWTIPGWTTDTASTSSPSERIGHSTRITDGTESTPVVATLDSGSSQMASVAQRFSGIDTADPHNSNNIVDGGSGSVTTITIAANSITGLESGSGVLVIINTDASRSVSSTGGQLTDLGSSASSFTNVAMLYDADAGGSGNPEYSITMNSSRSYNWRLVELKASSASSSIVPILQNHARRRRQ